MIVVFLSVNDQGLGVDDISAEQWLVLIASTVFSVVSGLYARRLHKRGYFAFIFETLIAVVT